MDSLEGTMRSGGGAFLIGWSRRQIQDAVAEGPARYMDETMVVAPIEIVPGPHGLVAPAGSLPGACLTRKNADGDLLSGIILPAATPNDAAVNVPHRNDDTHSLKPEFIDASSALSYCNAGPRVLYVRSGVGILDQASIGVVLNQ